MKTKRILALFLSFLLILSSFGTVAFADTENAVAKVGNTEYATIDEALAGANSMTGDVTVEIYGKVEYTDATPNLTGTYDTISFVGKTADAEISITRNGTNGYICGNANGTPNVTFTDLILSKPTGSFADDAGFMNVYFTVYRAGTVTYTNCTFPDGACAQGGTVTYTDCTFANQTSGEYSLWVYANADVSVNGGSFTGVRGAKMYTESKSVEDAGTLSLNSVTFTESVTEKPAIVLTYGDSVTLADNTYPSKGVFELDLDGAPNGTTVTSTDAITCVNDDGACGVLVDGKIYTTVAQAAEVATEGSTVTLLHNSTETVEFAEGVTLNKNGYVADGVTISTPEIAGKVAGGFIKDETGESYICSEISNLYATKSVELKLYDNEDTLLATTTLQKSEYYVIDSLTVKFCIADTSSSWKTVWEDAKLHAAYVPKKIVLYVDGQEMNSTDVHIWTAGESPLVWGEVNGVSNDPIEVSSFDDLVKFINKDVDVKLACDITSDKALVTSGITATIDLNDKTLNVRAGDNKFNDVTKLTIKNGTINIDGVKVSGNAIFCLDEYEKTLVTELTLENVNVTGKDYSSAYGVFYIGASSKLTVIGGAWNLSNDTSTSGGVFKADTSDAALNISGTEMTLYNVRRVVTYADTVIQDSTLTISGDADGVDAEMEHGFNRSPLVIDNSKVTMTNLVGRGITAENGAVEIKNNSTVAIENALEATIDVRNNQTLTVSADSEVSVDEEPTVSSGSSIDGNVTVEVPFDLEGEGTEESPYLINTLNDLKAFRDDVNGGSTYDGKYVKLTADINLSSIEWIPIGNGTRSGSTYTGNAFKGTFDGLGHKISGLTITTSNTADCAGLFGVLDGATVKNVEFTDVAINSAKKNAGALAGLSVNNSTISDIKVSGSVTAIDGAGGVIGRMTISGTVSGCVNNADVSGAAAGGIVGKAYYTATGFEINISNCENNGTMTSTAAGCAGGIVGFSSANVGGCINNGKITSNTGAGISLGGIVGWQQMYGEISGNTNNGSVASDNYVTTAGGIVGWVNYQYATDGTSAEYPNCEVVSVRGNTNTASIIAPESVLGSGGIVGGAYNAVRINENTNRAEKITGNAFAAGILGNYQHNDANGYNGDAKTLTVTDNTTYTKIDSITANCTNVVCYDNVFYSTNDYTLTNTVVTETPVAKIGNVEYASLEEAVSVVKSDGGILKLLANGGSITINDANKVYLAEREPITIDLNGYVLSSGESTLWVSDGYDVTVIDSSEEKTGKIISSNVGGEAIAIARGGKVTLESGYVYNPAYAVYLYYGAANGKESFTMNGGTVVSDDNGKTIAVGSGNVTINDGKLIVNKTTGGCAAYVWECGKLDVKGGSIYGALGGYNGNLDNSIISVSGGTFGFAGYDGLDTRLLADDYTTKTNDDGTVSVVKFEFTIDSDGWYVVSSYKELVEAFKNDNAKVRMTCDITGSANQSSGYGVAGICLDAGDILDGGNHRLTINGANNTWDCAIAMRGGEVKNLTISGAMRGVFMPGANGDVLIDNCVFDGVVYTFNSDAGNTDYSVTIKNSVLNGWTSYSAVHNNVTFETCEFGEGNGYAFFRPYQSTSFKDCNFAEDYRIDTSVTEDDALSFEDCTYDNEPISAGNAADLFYNGGKVLVDGVSTNYTRCAQIGEGDNAVKFTSLEAAVNSASDGDEIVVLADVNEDVTVPAGVIFNGNGKQVGTITAAGEITFKGHTKATNFGTQYTNTTINIGEGACLELTGTRRMVIGHGCTFNITGSITDAKTANTEELMASLIAPGASFTGAGVNFNVTNAYIKFTAYCSSKNSNASGTFNFNVINSIWEQTGSLVFSEPTEGMDPTFNFNLKDSVLNSTSHLVFAVTKGEIVIDNSVVNKDAARQLENRSTLTIKNGSFVNATDATSSNAKKPGTLIVDNATYVGSGEFSGSDIGIGSLILKNNANVILGTISKTNITVDGTSLLTATKIADTTTTTVKVDATSMNAGESKKVIELSGTESIEGIVRITEGATVTCDTDGDVTVTKPAASEEKLKTQLGHIIGYKTEYEGQEYYQAYVFGGIDSLDYQNVGYEVTFRGITLPGETRTVYDMVTAGGVDIYPNKFGDGNKYIIAMEVLFPIDETSANESFKFRVFATNHEDKKIYSDYKIVDKTYE